jgi:hypothetical protein
LSRASLDLTLEFIKLIDAAKSPSEITSVILKCVAPYGFENVFAGTMPAVAASRSARCCARRAGGRGNFRFSTDPLFLV